jgi:hypothetical protein
MGRRHAVVEERRVYVQQLMLAGYTLAQVIRFGKEHGWTDKQARADYSHISDEWSKQSEEELAHARAQAIQRIRSDLARMRVVTDNASKTTGKSKKGRKGLVQSVEHAAATYKDLVAAERLLAQIEGTLRPIEVKVSIGDASRRALIDTINGMSPAEMNALVAEHRELELRASGKAP